MARVSKLTVEGYRSIGAEILRDGRLEARDGIRDWRSYHDLQEGGGGDDSRVRSPLTGVTPDVRLPGGFKAFQTMERSNPLGGRSTVGQRTLTPLIGDCGRIPASQPAFARQILGELRLGRL